MEAAALEERQRQINHSQMCLFEAVSWYTYYTKSKAAVEKKFELLMNIFKFIGNTLENTWLVYNFMKLQIVKKQG